MTQTYPHFAFFYFSSGYSMSLQFRFLHDTPFAELIPTLNSLLQFPENWKMVKLEYRSPSLDPEGKVKFTPFELKNDDDLEVMWTSYQQYSSKVSIELDAKLQRSGEDVNKLLCRLQLPVYCVTLNFC
ncbi:uncharacterized protein LOC131621965 [Vicia villosa]|uniref:uncharacterized protein LOC131621965 n=1 Tax=Vicia villosa TaxID=3911 RepID=UPI00273BCF6D|nr:uncharacterized protein LOC131621965 [Vicia villosa]